MPDTKDQRGETVKSNQSLSDDHIVEEKRPERGDERLGS
jgi:hypothetical protein